VTFREANIFFPSLVATTSPETEAMQDEATALFEAIERGKEGVTTSEAVLAEVAFVLAPRQYCLSADAAAYLALLIQLPGLTLSRGQKHRYLRAIDIWVITPTLGFVDALTVALVEDSPIELATFDADFDTVPGIARWRPPTVEGTP